MSDHKPTDASKPHVFPRERALKMLEGLSDESLTAIVALKHCFEIDVPQLRTLADIRELYLSGHPDGCNAVIGLLALWESDPARPRLCAFVCRLLEEFAAGIQKSAQNLTESDREDVERALAYVTRLRSFIESGKLNAASPFIM